MTNRSAHATLERVEARTLLSGTITFAEGLLTLHGSDADNAISVRRTGNQLKVKLDHKIRHFRGVRGIVIDGHGGDDHITVANGCGDVTLLGGEGDDQLFTGDGNDQLDGGAGDDILDAGRGADMCIGGEGSDTADYSHRTASLHLGPGSACGEAGENDFLTDDIENLIGGEGNDDILVQNGNPNRHFVIHAGGGDDEIHAYVEGKLTVFCGAGNDFLDIPDARELRAFGQDGDDHLDGTYSHTTTTLVGGRGNDLFHPFNLDRTVVEGGEGYDHLDLSQFTYYSVALGGLDLRSDPVTHIEKITGSSLDDLIIAGDDPMLIIGGDYEEVGDTLIGGRGDDTLVGSWGDDLIIGNGGSDLMFGGPQPDDDGGDDVFINGGDGEADTVNGMAGDDTADDDPLDTLLSIETIV